MHLIPDSNTQKVNENILANLAQRRLSFLRLSAVEWEYIKGSRHQGTRFTLNFPHEDAKAGRPNSLVIIEVLTDRPHLRLGIIRSKQPSSTLDSRVVFDFAQPIHPSTLSELIQPLQKSTLKRWANKLPSSQTPFQPLSLKLGLSLFNEIASKDCNASVLCDLSSRLSKPMQFRNARAMQQDAIKLALRAFGHSDTATSIVLPGPETALATVRLHEDAVIEHDAREIQDLRLVASSITGRAKFENYRERLEVITANKRPLEELFGVDLIYYNRLQHSLVMVQYKMMEPSSSRGFSLETSEENEWTVRLDKQFWRELERMEAYDKEVSPDGPYRLNSSPFFIKLVKRYGSAQKPGIVLSLGHLQQLITAGGTSGPRGGLRISYRDLAGHYLRSDPFIGLVRSGYIGSRSATTEHFNDLIDATISGGRALVAAIHSEIALHDSGAV